MKLITTDYISICNRIVNRFILSPWSINWMYKTLRLDIRKVSDSFGFGFSLYLIVLDNKISCKISKVIEKYSSCLDDLHYKIHYMIYLMNMAKKLGDRRERGSDGYNYPLEPIVSWPFSFQQLSLL